MAETILITGVTGFVGFQTLRAVLSSTPGTTRVRAPVRDLTVARNMLQLQELQSFNAISRVDLVHVPDITVPDAYDAAMVGCKAAIHLAAPIGSCWTPEVCAQATGENVDMGTFFRNPTVKGTVNVLSAAMKASEEAARTGNGTPAVRRVVIGSAVFALMAFTDFTANNSGVVYTSRSRPPPIGVGDSNSNAPYVNSTANRLNGHAAVSPKWASTSPNEAYNSAKAEALLAAEAWMSTNAPLPFEVCHAFLGLCIGRDSTRSDSPERAFYGPNRVVLGPVCKGANAPALAVPTASLHVEDAGRVLATLALRLDGLGRFGGLGTGVVVKSGGKEGTRWEDVKGIVDNEFGMLVKQGVLPNTGRLVSSTLMVDDEGAEDIFGFQLRGLNEQVKSVVGWWVELLGKEMVKSG